MSKKQGSDNRHDEEILKQAEKFKTGDAKAKAEAAEKIREEVKQANQEHPRR